MMIIEIIYININKYFLIFIIFFLFDKLNY